jgi:hypothetical protein
MLLNRRGDIVWQRPYPRGRAAQFNAVAEYADGFMVAVGQSTPARVGTGGGTNGGNRAAWVMVFDAASGEPAWQRYYRSDMHLSGRDIMPEGDVFSVLLDARRPEGSEADPAARLVTLNGRGNVVGNEFFENAEGVQVEQVIRGKTGERIIVGTTTATMRTPIVNTPGPPKPGSKPQVTSEDDPSVEVTRSRDLWAVAAVPVRAEEDACKSAAADAQ